MQVAACHPSRVEEVAEALAIAQARGPSFGRFVAVGEMMIKGAEFVEDVVPDETLDPSVIEIREVAQ